MLYSAEKNGFYLRELHGDAVPADAVEITEERHAELIAAQNTGREIVADEGGYPILVQHDPSPAPSLSRAEFVVALTKATPPILTEAEALAALEAFPPKFAAALADKPLAHRAAAVEAWRIAQRVARDAPLFLDLLAFYAAQVGLSEAQAEALGDAIFLRGQNVQN